MADKKIVSGTKVTTKDSLTAKHTNKLPLFEKDNYMWMGIGALVVVIGMFIMSGGKNTDPNQFDTKIVYSTTRITIAPLLIIIGFLVEIYAIFKRPKLQS